MVAKKRLPSLRRRSSPPSHVLGDRRLPDIDAKLEQFAVDPWSAPERVGDADVSDQLPNVYRHLRTTATRSRPPSPIQAKTCAVPTNDRFWSDNCDGAQHTRSQAIQPNKYHPVDAAEGRPLRRLAPQNIELVAKRQDLDFQRSSRSEQSNQPAPDQFAELDHRAAASPDSRIFASRTRFATGTAASSRPCSEYIDLRNILFSGSRAKASLKQSQNGSLPLAPVEVARFHAWVHRNGADDSAVFGLAHPS